jgi:hypothetical protein
MFVHGKEFAPARLAIRKLAYLATVWINLFGIPGEDISSTPPTRA